MVVSSWTAPQRKGGGWRGGMDWIDLLTSLLHTQIQISVCMQKMPRVLTLRSRTVTQCT